MTNEEQETQKIDPRTIMVDKWGLGSRQSGEPEVYFANGTLTDTDHGEMFCLVPIDLELSQGFRYAVFVKNLVEEISGLP
jgi:hypothetical protein